jgi:hypothetical protein
MNSQKTALLTRIEILEQEIAEIKAKLLSEETRPVVKLEGLWEDIEVTDEDFEDAKRSLFPELDDI